MDNDKLDKTIKAIQEWIGDDFADEFPLGIMQDALELLKGKKIDGTGKMMVMAVKNWLDDPPFPSDAPIMAIGYCLNLLLDNVVWE